MNVRTTIGVYLLGALICCACTRHADEQAKALYEQGKTLREQGEPAQAMQVFLRAARSGTQDEALLGRVYSNIANLCRQADDHEAAFRIYTVSADHFMASGDTLAYAYALNNIAWEQAVMGHKDSALMFIDSAVQTYPSPPLTEKIIETRAAACFFAQEYDSVLYYSIPPANDYLLMLRAQAYSYLSYDDSATYYAHILLPRTTNLFYLDDLYYILTHNDTEADKEEIRRLSSARTDVQQDIERRHGKLTQAVQLMENELNRTNSPWLIIAYMCALLVSIGLSIWAIVIHRRHIKLHHALNEQEEQRRHEIERNIRLVLNADDMRAELCWNNYASFQRQIDKRFMGLASKLEAQRLKEQDTRLCVLVLLGLPHKHIADILNCSPKSIGKLKDLTARKLYTTGGHLREAVMSQVLN